MKDLPDRDELVIGTIKKIFPYGAFCDLQEYNKEGFIHISEVAPRWIKNIHNFLKEGQRIVGRVHRIVPEKNLIDISLKRVSDIDKQRKLDSYRREKRSTKLIQLIEKKVKNSTTTPEAIKKELIAVYGEVFSGLEQVSLHGAEALEETKIPKEWATVIIEVSQQSIKHKDKVIIGYLDLRVPSSDGIEVIKKALEVKDVKIIYLGAPRYMITVEGEDYKICEKKLKNVIESVTKSIKKSNGLVSFERKD